MTNIQLLIQEDNFGAQVATVNSKFELTLPEETPNHIASTLTHAVEKIKYKGFVIFTLPKGVKLLNVKTVSDGWYKCVVKDLGNIYFSKRDNLYLYVEESFFNNLSSSNSISATGYGNLKLQPVLDVKETHLVVERDGMKIPANVVRDMINKPLDILSIDVFKGKRVFFPTDLEAKDGQSKFMCYVDGTLAVVTMGILLGGNLQNTMSINIDSYKASVSNTHLLEAVTDTILNNYLPKEIERLDNQFYK